MGLYEDGFILGWAYTWPDVYVSEKGWAIAVKEKNSNKIVGHIPKPLAKILYPLMKSWKVYEITCTITGQSRKAPEGTWVLGGGIELPCRYFLYGPKIRKREVRKCIKDNIRNK